MSDKPSIGIAATSQTDVAPYRKILHRHGGGLVPVLADREQSADDRLRRVHGLLVTEWSGGGFAVSLVRTALERNMPVLAVHEGMHALNVAFGGDGPEDIQGHGVVQDEPMESSYHRIFITPGSKLAAIVGSGGFVRVNSRHLQGLTERQRSPRLMTSAYALDDGVMEGLESPDHDWVIGVQFSPERRMEVPPHFDRLFQGLVERAERVLESSPRMSE